MKPTLLATLVAATLTFGAQASAVVTLDKAQVVKSVKQDQYGVEYLDANDPKVQAELAALYRDAGWTEQNSPQLYRVLRAEQKASPRLMAPMVQTISTENTEIQLESMFMHLGFEVVDTGTSKVFRAALLNSEPVATHATTLTLKLVNEQGQQLTKSSTVRFIGDDPNNLNRKTSFSETPAELAYDFMSRSKKVMAEGLAFVVKADGSRVIKRLKVKYNRSAVMGMLARELGKPYVRVQAAQNVMSPRKDKLAIHIEDVRKANTDMDTNSLIVADFDYKVDHPKDTRKADADDRNMAGEDGKIMVCLNRDYGDCDYPMVQAGGDYNNIPHVTIPFKGSITIKTYVSDLFFPEDTAAHDNAVAPTDILIQSKESFANRLSENVGNTRDAIRRFFTIDYKMVNFLPITTVSWDIPREHAVFAKPGIFERRKDAYWILNLGLIINELGSPEDAAAMGLTPEEYAEWNALDNYIIASRDANQDGIAGAVYSEDPLQFSYSCLAKGSLILLPNGQTQAIETLNIGDLVLGASEFDTKHQETLRIADISVGVEHLPMIKLTTSDGEVLMLTESHPVVLANGEPEWALNVKKGDEIQTHDGLATIAQYEKVDYRDKVYNLKLERAEGTTAKGESFAMFANGISVGDLAMQAENEFDTYKETVDDVLNRIPSEWHTDYLNSLEIDKK
ncbi:Hint domain-containing protein [Pseudoalteromonas rubra]|uniref:Hint domain-containing protein n=1 Tax=Pseudoalteromonas rubra TaxID=43658 RepID=UPI000F7A0F3B|nr:Hint domain-containing protein [Pseudoalteromonas rubra]